MGSRKKLKSDVRAFAKLHQRDHHEEVRKLLRKGGHTIKEIAEAVNLTEALASAVVTDLQHSNTNIKTSGERISIAPHPEPASIEGHKLELETDAHGWIYVGAVADSHLGSKFERLDCLNAMYDKFAAEGIETVLHAGNWIEGEDHHKAPSHELVAHGVDGQLSYLAEKYPRRDGITTYAVTGDDHEGWFQQKLGVDIGKAAEQEFRAVGRHDWVNLGYQCAYVKLIHAASKKWGTLQLEHPGGGSSYADSYVVQKIIESLDGGEKPSVALFGHYHKQGCFNYRNVWAVLVPCTKDQDSFARKKRLRYVKGGCIIGMHLDKRTGAVDEFIWRPTQFFNKGFYDDRWDLRKPTKPRVEKW